MNLIENKNLYITFQPLKFCEPLKNKSSLQSNNPYLYKYNEKFGFNPIFAINLSEDNIEYLVSSALLSYPRNPEVAIVFEKRPEEVLKSSRLSIFNFDKTNNNQSNNLTWESQENNNTGNLTNVNNNIIIDYISDSIRPDEIKGIYKVLDNRNSILYDNRYRYEHEDYINWVIERFSAVVYEFNKNIDISKIPMVDTNTIEFLNVIQVIYNQLIYRPEQVDERDFMTFENIIESWLYDEISPLSLMKYNNLNNNKLYTEEDNYEYQENIKNIYIKEKHGLPNKLGFVGSEIEPFGNQITTTPRLGYIY